MSSSTSSSLSSPGSNASPTTTTKVEQGSLVQVKTEISNDLEQQKPQPQQQVITINGQQVMVSFDSWKFLIYVKVGQNDSFQSKLLQGILCIFFRQFWQF